MNSRHKYYIPLLMALLLYACPLRAQDSVSTEDVFAEDTVVYNEADTTAAEDEVIYTAPADRHIDQAVWDSLCADKAFVYRNQKEGEKEPVDTKPGFWMRLFLGILGFFATTLGQWLFWGFIVLVFGYIIYRVLKGELGFVLNRKDSMETTAPADGAISEEDLLHSDWEQKIQQALQEDNKAQATRFALMHILQLMQQSELIRYRIDKTNHEYYLELTQEDLRQPFRDLLLRYEFAWFGRFAVSAEAWADTQIIYRQLKSGISR